MLMAREKIKRGERKGGGEEVNAKVIFHEL